MTFKTEVKCKYCKKAFLDGLKGIRKEPFVCNECEDKHKDIFLIASDIENSTKVLNECLDNTNIDSSMAEELLNNTIKETLERINLISSCLNSNL